MLMSEIRSVAEVAEAYVAEIRSSAKNLASDGASVTKDRITSLVVNPVILIIDIVEKYQTLARGIK